MSLSYSRSAHFRWWSPCEISPSFFERKLWVVVLSKRNDISAESYRLLQAKGQKCTHTLPSSTGCWSWPCALKQGMLASPETSLNQRALEAINKKTKEIRLQWHVFSSSLTEVSLYHNNASYTRTQREFSLACPKLFAFVYKDKPKDCLKIKFVTIRCWHFFITALNTSNSWKCGWKRRRIMLISCS